MSRFFSKKYASLVPYIPGEQPQDLTYIKLNTNESPFPPSPAVVRAAEEESRRLHLYSDPDCRKLREKMSAVFGLSPERILMTNGSDEALNFAFMAFADAGRPLAFPDITYGFYPVFAKLNQLPYTEIPLREDFSVDIQDYIGRNQTIVLANPNAPTGLCLSLSEIEQIVRSNPDNLVIIDEAYIDFGGKSAVSLIDRYENLLVVGTFSKSRSMAGARLGFAFGRESLIEDLQTLRFSTNPYNVNRMTSAAGIAALDENDYYLRNCEIIRQNREWTAKRLTALGFHLLPSSANFLFAESERIGGEQLYLELKKRGVLVRHFAKERIRNYNRITIGTDAQMQALIEIVETVLKECTP